MARKKTKPVKRRAGILAESGAEPSVPLFCGLPPLPPTTFAMAMPAEREEILIVMHKRWVDNTPLTYYFYNAPEAQKAVVRRAFKTWNDAGCGLEFTEVTRRGDAELGIGFTQGDGSWSYIGRDALDFVNQRTMNFGWDLTDAQGMDTALHEIGHALGFPHEHQNPKAGIEWNEPAVYAALAKPPNRWDRAKTFHNIIRKLDPREVAGSTWDKNSIMHYPFEAELILRPPGAIHPAGGLSAQDKKLVTEWYPGKEPRTQELKPFAGVVLKLDVGEQASFDIRHEDTRFYDIFTIGEDDTVMELFEEKNGELSRIATADDSGTDKNAAMREKLERGKKYVLRVRTNYTDRPGACTVILA